jgi:hypothetical protein
MPTSPARTADDIADNIRSLIDRVVDAKFTQEMAKRGQDVAEVLAERGAEVGELATEAWRDSKPLRRDAAKRLAKTSGEAAKWSDQTWRKSLRPFIKDLWKQRTVAIGAAGAAVPVGRSTPRPSGSASGNAARSAIGARSSSGSCSAPPPARSWRSSPLPSGAMRCGAS